MILLLNINSKTFVFLSSRGHNGDFSSLSASPWVVQVYRLKLNALAYDRLTTCFHQFYHQFFSSKYFFLHLSNQNKYYVIFREKFIDLEFKIGEKNWWKYVVSRSISWFYSVGQKLATILGTIDYLIKVFLLGCNHDKLGQRQLKQNMNCKPEIGWWCNFETARVCLFFLNSQSLVRSSEWISIGISHEKI